MQKSKPAYVQSHLKLRNAYQVAQNQGNFHQETTSTLTSSYTHRGPSRACLEHLRAAAKNPDGKQT